MENFTDIKNADCISASKVCRVVNDSNFVHNFASKPVHLDKDTGLYIFECPHCNLLIEVEQNQVNCHIFRHAFLIQNINGNIILVQQLNPHASKEQCDSLRERGQIVGCGKPFKFVRNPDNSYRAEICDYI